MRYPISVCWLGWARISVAHEHASRAKRPAHVKPAMVVPPGAVKVARSVAPPGAVEPTILVVIPLYGEPCDGHRFSTAPRNDHELFTFPLVLAASQVLTW